MWFVAAPFITLGLFTAYCIYRFGRKGTGLVDQSARGYNYIKLMWIAASQPHLFKGIAPWISDDLGEQTNPETQDGRIT